MREEGAVHCFCWIRAENQIKSKLSIFQCLIIVCVNNALWCTLAYALWAWKNKNKFILEIRRAGFSINADSSLSSSNFLTSCTSTALMLHKLHVWNWILFRIFLSSSGFVTCSLIYRLVCCNRDLDGVFFPHFFTWWPHNYLPAWLNSWIWDQINSLHINEHIKYKEHINSKSLICLLALEGTFSKGITLHFALHQVQDWACSSGGCWNVLLSSKSKQDLLKKSLWRTTMVA